MTLLNATGWTLTHFLWQAAGIVALFAIADSASRTASARTRYAIGLIRHDAHACECGHNLRLLLESSSLGFCNARADSSDGNRALVHSAFLQRLHGAVCGLPSLAGVCLDRRCDGLVIAFGYPMAKARVLPEAGSPCLGRELGRKELAES